MYRSIHFCTVKDKNEKKNKYNTADQVVDMQAVNFVLMKHNYIFFLFWITIDKRFFIQ